MNELFFIISSTVSISAIAFIGILTLLVKEKLLDKILLVLISLSAGTLMGSAFLHLLPEAVEKTVSANSFLYVLVGFVLFFLVEKIFYWRHCHKGKCDVHTFKYMNLVGDTVHNFIDGLIVAASFLVDVKLGITTTIAIAAHEVPQEIGDFGVLVYGGFKKTKALMLNFFVALSIVLGGVTGYFVSSSVEQFTTFLLPIAAGGFIYIASSDLIPEIREVKNIKKSIFTFIAFLIGIFIMSLV